MGVTSSDAGTKFLEISDRQMLEGIRRFSYTPASYWYDLRLELTVNRVTAIQRGSMKSHSLMRGNLIKYSLWHTSFYRNSRFIDLIGFFARKPLARGRNVVGSAARVCVLP